ncbi:helix-turn-helix domain-containing protein [Nocardioides sp. MAH-18]|uniref:Helix-turn-helix domain-containing protein n=1 Tax=Nocardioides agri TaxID=2682843 RepID=A0A6L6XZ92_9ACTN|nr:MULTISPECIES: helix-turn-helix domain-containing protein [unclassified Nocardioides]MBA2955866.1 AraC family transcriptional regulator [Nocardioides sp. CGMCC 1.13656]MVQ50715.1 helix-turn-helix domain-containing protein [Nocardioides sp. MAH-18]
MTRRIDPTERAHLLDASGYAPPIHRFAPSPELADVVRRYWMPVWSLPDGQVSLQRVLQYPVCLVVVSADYALLVGPTTGLSTQELSGSGWALGTMLHPAAGQVLAGGPITRLTDVTVPLDDDALAGRIRSAVGDHPDDPDRQQAAVAEVESWLRTLLPVDDEGLLVNAIVEHVEGDPSVQRVGQVCEKFAITERTLQRLTARRIGLTPKWLIQRRRLHEAAERLADAERPDLARVAADLGYSDQSHFARDWRAVTGLTPGEYAAEPRR